MQPASNTQVSALAPGSAMTVNPAAPGGRNQSQSLRANTKSYRPASSINNLMERARKSTLASSMDGLDARSRDFLETEMQKDQRKMNKLHRIKDALEALARRDVETMKDIKVRRMQREKAALDATYGRKFNEIDKDKKVTTRRLNAKRAVAEGVRTADRRSLQNWKEHQKEVVRRQEIKAKRERLTSAKDYRQNNGLEVGAEFFQDYPDYQQMRTKTFDMNSSQGRPMSGELSRTRAMYQSDLGATRTKDDLPEKEMDAASQATGGAKPRPKLAQSASRPKSSYSVTMKNRKMKNMLEGQVIEQAMSEYHDKLLNASLNM